MVWSLWKRIAFRFGFSLLVVYVWPWPIYFIPKMSWLATALNKPLTWLTAWFGETVLDLEPFSKEDRKSVV